MCGSTLSLTSARDGSGWSTPRSGCFTPGKETQYLLYRGWVVPGPTQMSAENCSPTEIRSPDRPARSESLYRLSYLGPQNKRQIKCVHVRHICMSLAQSSLEFQGELLKTSCQDNLCSHQQQRYICCSYNFAIRNKGSFSDLASDTT